MPLNASELLVVLGAEGPAPLRVRLASALRDAVRAGRIAPGATLPSSRVLARDLGVSRGVVTEAYAQLAAEGFVISRPGAGTMVASARVEAPTGAARSDARPTLAPGTIDLRPGLPDLSSFPRQQWAAAVRDTLRDLPAARLGYTEPWGALALREQLSQHLARVRGASVQPESVVVMTGATQGISLIAQLLRRRGHSYVAVEDPSNAIQRRLLTDLGLSIVDVPVDWQGLDVDVLAASPAQVVICTPAHQYPTGVIMSATRREQLCRWAQEQDALIVEDDYDSEFSYGPVVQGCLQGMVPQHVALVGSVSKSLAPALRLGWVITPPSLLLALRQAKSHADFGSNFLEQEVLAELIASAAYDRNLRRLRRRYGERRRCLAQAVERELPGWRVMGAAAGLHFVVQVPDRVDETRLVAAAAAQGVAVIGIAGMVGSNPHGPAIVLSFAGATPDMLEEAVVRLAQAVAAMDSLTDIEAHPAISRIEWYEQEFLQA